MEVSPCDTDFDLFDDIFKGGLSSHSPDSGHDSPQSGFGAYQDDLPWESLPDDDIWSSYLQTSLLDDLPDDLSDSSTECPSPLRDNIKPANINHMQLGNTTKTSVEIEHDYLQTVDMREMESANIKSVDSGGWDATITNSFLPSVKNDADMPAINNTDCQDLSNIITNESKSVVSLAKLQARSVAQTKSSTAPMLLKPIAIIKGSNGILNTVDSKSQIKIGNNIFAIIQKGSGVNSNVSGSSKMTTLREELIKTPRTFSLRDELAKPVKAKLFPPNMNFTPKHEDHDYIDDTDIRMGGTMGISKGIGPGLQLTDEEKKLLELESCIIPTDMPLTKDEEKVLKKVRRKIKNKQSAMESRRRRKDYIENLERRVKHCTDQNQDLKKTVNRLTEDNKSLMTQLKQLQELVASSVQQSRSAQTGTCLAVLLFSLAFFFLPFNPLAYTNDGVQKAITVAPNARPSSFRSRTLLEVDTKHNGNESFAVQHSLNMSNAASGYDVNSSKLYTEEIRAEIDRLLLSDDANVGGKLNDYLQLLSENSYVSINHIHSNTVNIVEVDADNFRPKRQVEHSDDF